MVHGKSRKLNRGGPCVQCGATQSTLFRRSPEGTMCNPCGLRHKRQLQKQQRESIENVHEGYSEQHSNENCVSDDTDQLLFESKHYPETQPEDALVLQPSDERKICSFCSTDISPLWRAVDGNLACNKCALRARRKGKRHLDALTEDGCPGEDQQPQVTAKRRATQGWHSGLSGEPAPAAIDNYVRELASCGHITADDMRIYLCLWTELSTEQRKLAREAITAARADGDTTGGADHVRLVVSHNEAQYGRKVLIRMVHELMGPFEGRSADGCGGELLVA